MAHERPCQGDRHDAAGRAPASAEGRRSRLGGAAGPLCVTGAGLVSAAGRGLAALERALESGRSLLGPLRQGSGGPGGAWGHGRFDAGRHGAQVDDALLASWEGLRPDDDRVVPLAALAMEEALAEARPEGAAIALSLGTALGPAGALERAVARGGGSAGVTGAGLPGFDGCARRLEEALDGWCEGPGAGRSRRADISTHLFSVTCVSGLCALEDAAARLALGRAGAVLWGSFDALTAFMHGGFSALGALSPTGRLLPFDEEHDGILLGEAAAFAVVEPLASARARGAAVRAVVLGQRLVSDAVHLTSPDAAGRGMARAIEGALRDAGVGPGEVGCVVVTATGSAPYDRMQARAVRAALGERAAREVPVTTWEPAVGHVLAATGTLGVLFAARAIERGVVPGFSGPRRTDPDCGLRLALGSPVPLRSPCALALTVGFGGQNGAAVVASAAMAADVARRGEDG
ncbi:MAG: hypothetical protein HY721_17735 [Planctomycetes bacterium]|nr:hypothetical protein [Planctomycetota bacterium]